MGIVCGKPTLSQDAEISRAISKEAKNEKKVKKLLLLGAGESGKSTILKQIKFLFKTGFDESERKSYVPVIHANVYQSIQTLSIGCKQFAEVEGEGSSVYTLQPENEEFADALLEIDDPDNFPSLNEETAIKVQRFWSDPAIQAAYARGNEMQLPDCTFFFLENVLRLAKSDYTPSQEDVLYARQQTTGIVEIDFSAEFGNKSEVYKLFDVGGQRNERMKWIHLFDGVTAIIFCVALSEYNQVLAEENTKNRMMETMELFEWLLKQKWFEKTSFLLFLNKFDLFQEKVKKVPLDVCERFRDYRPSPLPNQEVEHAYGFIKKKFEEIYERNTPPNNVSRVFHIYKTTALDKSLIKQTFYLVNEALTLDMLTAAGLL